jgi:hypothetical protein
MKTIKRIIALSVLASVFVFSGCEKDESSDENEMMPKDEAQQLISNTSQQVAQDMEGMQNTDGVKAMSTIDSMFSIHDPLTASKEGKNSSIIRSMNQATQPLEHSKAQRVGDEPFNFDQKTIEFEWNYQNNQWAVVTEEVDSIIFHFPSDSAHWAAGENNATLTIGEFTETMISTDTGDIYVPTDILADLYIDGNERMDLAYHVTYSANEIATADITLFLEPFTFAMSYNNDNNNLSASISKNGNTLLATDLTVTTDQTADDSTYIKKLDGDLQLRNLKLSGWAKPYDLNPDNIEPGDISGTPTNDNIINYLNDQLDVTLYEASSGQKVADVKVKDVSSNPDNFEPSAVFVFEDDSTAPVENFFGAVIVQYYAILSQIE